MPTVSSRGSSASSPLSPPCLAKRSHLVHAQLRSHQGRLLGPVRHHDVLPRYARGTRLARRLGEQDRARGQALGTGSLAEAGHGGLHVYVRFGAALFQRETQTNDRSRALPQSASSSSGLVSSTATTRTRTRSTLISTSRRSSHRRSARRRRRPPSPLS
jgi:hypothetical protein